jgi:hypothetical protein
MSHDSEDDVDLDLDLETYEDEDEDGGRELDAYEGALADIESAKRKLAHRRDHLEMERKRLEEDPIIHPWEKTVIPRERQEKEVANLEQLVQGDIKDLHYAIGYEAGQRYIGKRKDTTIDHLEKRVEELEALGLQKAPEPYPHQVVEVDSVAEMHWQYKKEAVGSPREQELLRNLAALAPKMAVELRYARQRIAELEERGEVSE